MRAFSKAEKKDDWDYGVFVHVHVRTHVYLIKYRILYVGWKRILKNKIKEIFQNV